MELTPVLKLTLNSNNGVFNSDNFIQISGTLMGGKYAPSYANVFMGKFENLSSQKPLVWYRFIDDIFLIWTGTKEELFNFIEHANSLHPTIRLTFEQSTSQVAFIDVLVKLTPDNAIATDLYTKPTDKHLTSIPPVAIQVTSP